jgi:hypothetical protein
LDISFHPLVAEAINRQCPPAKWVVAFHPELANLAIEKRAETMANLVIAFVNDKDLETLIYVHEIAKDDPTLVVDNHTWKPRNARKALEVLRAAIDDLLDECPQGASNAPSLVERHPGCEAHAA